jgi:hypothetical protein
VYAVQPIEENTAIAEYNGELVSQAEAWRHELRYLPGQRIWISNINHAGRTTRQSEGKTSPVTSIMPAGRTATSTLQAQRFEPSVTPCRYQSCLEAPLTMWRACNRSGLAAMVAGVIFGLLAFFGAILIGWLMARAFLS